MAKRRSLYKNDNNEPPSLYRKETNQRGSVYGRNAGNRRNGQTKINFSRILSGIFTWIRRNPKLARNIFLIVILLLAVFLVASHIPNSNNNGGKTSPTTTKIGNNSLGTVYKEGPYGNTNSKVSIAYILGVHPREQGAHRLMEQAFKENADSLNCSYYIYKINVTQSPTDYEESRLNGQLLGKEFVVPDIVNNNFTAAVDVHYSNGNWGVERFIFTPNENNTVSSQLGHAIANNFPWITYYTPPNPTSPQYVTGPLNDGGVGAIIYEAYTEDDNNVTLEHDREMVKFIDKWASKL